MLVAMLEQKLANRRPCRQVPTQRAPELLLDKLGEVAQRWLMAVEEHPELKRIAISSHDRLNFIPEIVAGICGQVLNNKDVLDEATWSLAMQHGVSRFSRNYTSELIVAETRLLQRGISRLFQEHMLSLDLSTLISDVMGVADLVVTASEVSLRSFREQSLAA